MGFWMLDVRRFGCSGEVKFRGEGLHWAVGEGSGIES